MLKVVLLTVVVFFGLYSIFNILSKFFVKCKNKFVSFMEVSLPAGVRVASNRKEKTTVRIFYLLDGSIKLRIWNRWDDVKYLAQALNENEAIAKGKALHEKNPELDAVWVEYELVGSRFVPKTMRVDLPPVFKMLEY